MAAATNWKRPWEEVSGAATPTTATSRSYVLPENPASVPSRPEPIPYESAVADNTSTGDGIAPLSTSTCQHESSVGDWTLPPRPLKRPRLHHSQGDRFTHLGPGWPPLEVDRCSSRHPGFPPTLDPCGMLPTRATGLGERQVGTPSDRGEAVRREGLRRGCEGAGRLRRGSPTIRELPRETPCPACGQLGHLVQDLAFALAELVAEIGCGSAVLAAGEHSSSQAPDVALLGLSPTLEWARGTVRNAKYVIRSRRANDRWGPSASSSVEGTYNHLVKSPAVDDPHVPGRRYDSSGREKEEHVGMAANVAAECRRKPLAGDLPPSSDASDRAESMGGAGMISPTSRLLPTPSSSTFPSGSSVLPTVSPSTQASHTPHVAHFQDLQHQVSTKTLALQSLQGEHDRLLAAYSRLKTRCATLDKKFEVSDAEMNKLIEERICLQSQVDALESQVDGLVKSRDDARSQSVANGGQYMKIMSMASRLEAQSAADKKRWTAEREEWERTREELNRRITQLEKDKNAALHLITQERCSPRETDVSNASAHFKSISPMPSSSSSDPERRSSMLAGHATEVFSPVSQAAEASTTPVTDDLAPDDIIRSDSVEVLRAEIGRLRKGCHVMEVALQDLKSDGYRIEQVMQKFGNIGKRVVIKVDVASQYLRRRKSAGDVVAVVDAGTGGDNGGGGGSGGPQANEII